MMSLGVECVLWGNCATKPLLVPNFKELQEGNVKESRVLCGKRLTACGLLINSHVALQQIWDVRIPGVSKKTEGIELTFDFNTSQEENYAGQLTTEKVRTIISEALNHIPTPNNHVRVLYGQGK